MQLHKKGEDEGTTVKPSGRGVTSQVDFNDNLIKKCIISEHIYIHIRDCAVCLYWVIQCYPGAVFDPRVYLI